MFPPGFYLSARGGEYGCVISCGFTVRGRHGMALSGPMPRFAHRRTVRLIVDDEMEIDALEIAKSLPEFAPKIIGIVPQFGGKCFDIMLDSADSAYTTVTPENPFASWARNLFTCRSLCQWNSLTKI